MSHEHSNTPPAGVDWTRHAIFLDFDGTLAPLVARPEDARLSTATRGAITRLGKLTDGALALLSGRALADLDALTHPLSAPASGSHGAEIRGPDGASHANPHRQALLHHPAEMLAGFACDHDLLVERKPGAVTIHYRATPDLAEECRSIVERLAAADPKLRAMHGHMVSEVALAGVDKGTALRQFMAWAPFRGRLPVMVGDDVTDEDAIRAAQAMGGFGIKIGDAPSEARYRAGDIGVFLDWLEDVSRPD